ncbi:MAG: peptidoglycan DD-metalloendopeptidase family protein [Acidobacteriota bacterium]|nr:peptidoglycan DD-metalloendopeptidase family protein [Acidobacteriota bacterium]
MRKALALPAAALAAVFLLGTSDRALARPAAPGKHVPAAAKIAKSRREPATRGARRAGSKVRQKAHPARSRQDTRKKAAPVARSAHRRPGKTLIRQNPQGEVVVERIAQRVPVPVASPPGELQNFPPAPCYPADVVIEAHVHEWRPAEPGTASADLSEEGDAPTEAAAPPARRSGAGASLGRMAARVGSFFRPKSGESEVRPGDVDLTELISADFQIPVEGVDAQRLRDSFLASRGRHAQHLAIDIGAPRGTPILATTDGEIVRTAKERRGGNSIYQKDATGQYLLFYCHLSRYAPEIVAGRKVKKGDVIGYVGSTGHVIGGSHLHFSITRMPEDDSNFRKGLAINPYLLFLAGVP